MILFPVLISLGIMLTFGMIGNSLFAQNNTALEQAQKSLDENQKKLSSNLPDTLGNQATKDSSQAASKITRGSGSSSTYENTDYGISIKFSNSWKHSEINLPQHGIVTFSAPEFGTPSSEVYVAIPAEVLVASQKLPVNNLTLPKFVESFLKDRYPNATDYKIISSSKSNLGGMESEQIIMYEYDVGNIFYPGGSLKLIRNIAIDLESELAYMIKYSAEPGMFSKYLPVAEQTIASFEVR